MFASGYLTVPNFNHLPTLIFFIAVPLFITNTQEYSSS